MSVKPFEDARLPPFLQAPVYPNLPAPVLPPARPPVWAQGVNLMQRGHTRGLQSIIYLNGYRVAAFILLILMVGAALDPNSTIFMVFTFLPPGQAWVFWFLTFLICAVVMLELRTHTRELKIAFFAFIVPVDIFFGALGWRVVSSAIQASKLPNAGPLYIPFFLLALLFVCIMILDLFVIRTSALNEYRTLTAELTVRLAASEALVQKYQAQNPPPIPTPPTSETGLPESPVPPTQVPVEITLSGTLHSQVEKEVTPNGAG